MPQQFYEFVPTSASTTQSHEQARAVLNENQDSAFSKQRIEASHHSQHAPRPPITFSFVPHGDQLIPVSEHGEVVTFSPDQLVVKLNAKWYRLIDSAEATAEQLVTARSMHGPAAHSQTGPISTSTTQLPAVALAEQAGGDHANMSLAGLDSSTLSPMNADSGMTAQLSFDFLNFGSSANGHDGWEQHELPVAAAEALPGEQHQQPLQHPLPELSIDLDAYMLDAPLKLSPYFHGHDSDQLDQSTSCVSSVFMSCCDNIIRTFDLPTFCSPLMLVCNSARSEPG